MERAEVDGGMARGDAVMSEDGKERIAAEEVEYITVRSDDPVALLMRAEMKTVAMRVLDEAKVEGERRKMILTIALVGVVWDAASMDQQIVTQAIKTLLGLAVDAGLGEAIGMKRLDPPGETLQ